MSVTNRLLFDVTDATSIAASANVGSWLRAGTDGALIDSKLIASTEWLQTASALFDGVGNALSSTTGALHISDGGASLTVDAVNLDIRDLAAATDSVSSWMKDGTGTAIGSTAGALNVNISSGTVSTNDAALANAAIVAAATVVGATLISACTAQTARKYAFFYNNGNKAMYLGSTGNTTADGFPMYPGMGYEFRAGQAIDFKVIADGAAQDLRHMQLA